MMLQTDDYYKMLFLSIWLTMARVINVQLKSAWLFYFVFEVVYGGVFDGICMCWCLFVCVCVYGFVYVWCIGMNMVGVTCTLTIGMQQ